MILFLLFIQISFESLPDVKILKKLIGSTLSVTIKATPAHQTFTGPSNVAVVVREFFTSK